MQNLVVPKTRKPKFDLTFKLIDINNIPYVTGKVYVKWNLPSSAETGSGTTKVPIKDHRSVFDYEKTVSVRLVVDKTGKLQESNLLLEVIHEVPTGGKAERSLLGNVKINLAEYVDATRHTPDAVQRRHLLQDSRINATLKVAIHMNQTEGEPTFRCPPLRSAPVFLGISGVMFGEQDASDTEEPATAISKTTSTTASKPIAKQADDMRDLYRKTLAAELSCSPGHPSADQVIEDIFTGGDGTLGAFENDLRPPPNHPPAEERPHPLPSSSPRHAASSRFHSRLASRKLERKAGRGSRDSLGKVDDPFRAMAASRARGSFGQGGASHHGDGGLGKEERAEVVPELEEMDVREDLRCWNSKGE